MLFFTSFLRFIVFLVTGAIFFHVFHWKYELVLFSFLTFCGGATVVGFMYPKYLIEDPHKVVLHMIIWSGVIEITSVILFWILSFLGELPDTPEMSLIPVILVFMTLVYMWNKFDLDDLMYRKNFPGKLTRHDRKIFLEGIRHFVQNKRLCTVESLAEKTKIPKDRVKEILIENTKKIILSDDEIVEFCLALSSLPSEIYFYEVNDVAYQKSNNAHFRKVVSRFQKKTGQIRNAVWKKGGGKRKYKSTGNLCCPDGPTCC